jgi:F-type H+-transporting ATPase subunit b
LRVVLSSVAFLFASSAVFASEGNTGIPWKDIVSHAINLGLLLSVLFYFVRKPLSSFLKERSELIRKSIDDAAAARLLAMKKLEEMDNRMAALSEEIAKLNASIESEAAFEAKALHDAATAEIERIRAQAQFSGEQELKKARAELRQEASVLATEAAQAMVRETLTGQDQERLVKENIEKIERIA